MFHTLYSSIGKLFSKNRLSILIYHQVLSEKDPMRPTEPCVQEFHWQMKLIRKYFKVLPLTEASELLSKNQLPRNAICITFDDGYLNNLTQAAPILSELQLPSTCFVATGFSQGHNMFNDLVLDLCGNTQLKAIDLNAIGMTNQPLSNFNQRRELAYQVIAKIKYLGIDERNKLIDQLYLDNDQTPAEPQMMTAEQVCQLNQLGVDIGGHTVDHPILKSLNATDQLQQIIDNKKLLEQWLGKTITSFAYPNGKLNVDYDKQTSQLVEQAGYQLAVSTNWGISKTSTNVFELNRFTPWDKKPLKFHLRLLRNLLGV